MIKAIIFDMGGVLVDLDIDACIKACKEEIGFDKASEMLDACHQKGVFQKLEQGTISEMDFAKEVLSMCRPGTTIEELTKAFHKLLVGIDPYKIDLLKDLSSRYDLYMLSNNNAISMVNSSRIFAQMGAPLETTFKKLFLSHEMHLLKPSDEIYRQTIREIIELSSGAVMSAENMLFIDDSMLNVRAARRNGMRAELYTPGSDLKALVEEALEKYI